MDLNNTIERRGVRAELKLELLHQLETHRGAWQHEIPPGVRRIYFNPVTGTQFSGVNAMTLGNMGTRANYNDPRFFTEQQGKACGFKLREGAKPIAVTYFKKAENVVVVRDRETGEERKEKREGKAYETYKYVYNASQFKGVPPLQSDFGVDQYTAAKLASQLLEKSGVTIEHASGASRVNVDENSILLPPPEQHKDRNDYYQHAVGLLVGKEAEAMEHTTQAEKNLVVEYAMAQIAMVTGIGNTRCNALMAAAKAQGKDYVKEFLASREDATALSERLSRLLNKASGISNSLLKPVSLNLSLEKLPTLEQSKEQDNLIKIFTPYENSTCRGRVVGLDPEKNLLLLAVDEKNYFLQYDTRKLERVPEFQEHVKIVMDEERDKAIVTNAPPEIERTR